MNIIAVSNIELNIVNFQSHLKANLKIKINAIRFEIPLIISLEKEINNNHKTTFEIKQIAKDIFEFALYSNNL
jgi:hypothetical protein